MNRILRLVIAAALVSVASVATVAAQSARFGVGGGLISPVSDYGNQDKTGWHVAANVEFAIPLSPFGVRVDGLYGQTDHQSPVNGNTKLAGGLVGFVWKIPTAVPLVKPYLLAGGGVYNFKQTFPSSPGTPETSNTKFTWAAGGGASLGVGPVHGFLEARYASIQLSGAAVKFIPVTAGLTFGAQ